MSTALSVLLFAALFAAYWMPSAVALARHVPDRGSVIVVDALLGWTVIGWVIALAMACRTGERP